MANPTYDQYEPIAGGFRARLANPLTVDANGSTGLLGVSLNATGRALKGDGGQSGLVGVTVKNVARGPIDRRFTQLHGGTPNPYAPIGVQKGDVIDIMTNGVIVNLDPQAFPAGSPVFVDAAGNASVTSAAGSYQIGHTVDAGVLIVRFVPGTPAVV